MKVKEACEKNGVQYTQRNTVVRYAKELEQVIPRTPLANKVNQQPTPSECANKLS